MAIFTCNLCPSTFTRKFVLDRHVATTHSDNKLQCDQCEKTFSLSQDLKRHVKAVHQQQDFECDVCDFTTTRKDSLNRHMDTKHGAKKTRIEKPIVEPTMELKMPNFTV